MIKNIKQDIRGDISPSNSLSGSVNSTDSSRRLQGTVSDTNAVNGKVGVRPGLDGKDGKDGFSPRITADPIEGGYRLTITNEDGTESIDVLNGIDGENGIDLTGGGIIVSLNFITGTASHSPAELLEACNLGKSISFDIGAGEIIHQVPIDFYDNRVTGSFSMIGNGVTIVTNVVIKANKTITVNRMNLNPMSAELVSEIVDGRLVSKEVINYFNQLINIQLGVIENGTY